MQWLVCIYHFTEKQFLSLFLLPVLYIQLIFYVLYWVRCTVYTYIYRQYIYLFYSQCILKGIHCIVLLKYFYFFFFFSSHVAIVPELWFMAHRNMRQANEEAEAQLSGGMVAWWKFENHCSVVLLCGLA